MLEDFVKFIFTALGGIVVALFSYNFIEVRKKRKLETYWKIETEYKSEDQQHARKAVELVEGDFVAQGRRLDGAQTEALVDQQLADYYNRAYHYSDDPAKRDMAWKIRTRIRFLHLAGVLLKKKMIDEDLLFSLIGLGFQIDYRSLCIILNAHRQAHETPTLYDHFEYLWQQYGQWKDKQGR